MRILESTPAGQENVAKRIRRTAKGKLSIVYRKSQN